MSVSSTSTIPFTPPSFADHLEIDESGENVFALLRPVNRPAEDAFHSFINQMIKYPEFYAKARSFVHTKKRSRESSVLSSDSDSEQSDNGTDQWSGVWKLSLSNLPSNPREGWWLGCGTDKDDSSVDLILVPRKYRKEYGVSGRHARLFVHPTSCRTVMEARHTVVVSKPNFTRLCNGEQQAVEHGTLIEIGACSYLLELTPHFKSLEFENALSTYMKRHVNSSWLMHRLISPASVGEPSVVGNYYCSPAAFAAGTFGQVTAGWSSSSNELVAIKRFKAPRQSVLEEHKAMMEYVGRHENVLELVECLSSFKRDQIPTADCIYRPLAMLELASALDKFTLDMAAKAILARDFLRGLSYLHQDKHLMHRDISPRNLAIASMQPVRGIILDLDSLTSDAISCDHQVGTIDYLAPEILRLKGSLRDHALPTNYDNSADMWAMGLMVWSLSAGQVFGWFLLASRDQRRYIQGVSYELWVKFGQWLGRAISTAGPHRRSLLKLVASTTEWKRDKRVTASWALQQAQELVDEIGLPGNIVPKGSLPQKRGLEDISR